MSRNRKTDDYFSNAHMRKNLASRTFSGGLATFGGQLARFGLQLGSTAVLARLLAPADFGLVAMVLVIVDFAETIRDAGLSMATVQRDEIDHQRVTTLFWVNLALGVSLMLLVVAGSPLIAGFYGEPRLTAIALVCSLSFLFTGLTAQHRALLQRHMNFFTLAGIDLASQAGSKAAAILAAYYGAGYWALVAMPVSVTAIKASLVWLFCSWRPSRPGRLKDVLPMLSFGASLTLNNVLGFLSSSLDSVLIGRLWGAYSLGLYSRCRNLLVLPTKLVAFPLQVVAIASLSRVQNEPERFRSLYRGLFETVLLLNVPLLVLVIFAADEVVLILLGDQWTAAIPLLRALGPLGIFQCLYGGTFWVLLASGQTGRLLKWRVVQTVALVAAMACAIPWGAIGIAWGLSIGSALLKVPEVLYCFRHTRVKPMDFWKAALPPLIASGLAAVVVGYLETLLPAEWVNPFVRFPVLGAGFAVIYLTIYALLPGGTAKLRRMRSILKDLRSNSGKNRNVVRED